jgi:hypothetical protein
LAFKPSRLLFLTLSISAIAYADDRDPTKPAFYSAGTNTDQNQSALNLSSIWVSAHSKRATINGITAKQGETILSTVKIIQILKNAVIIEQDRQRSKLYLLSRTFKTQQTK